MTDPSRSPDLGRTAALVLVAAGGGWTVGLLTYRDEGHPILHAAFVE